jgi:hypothetical protein
MNTMKRTGWIAGGVMGAAALAGVGHMARTWCGYGKSSSDGDVDPILDRFMPEYEVRERHEIRVAAPVADTYAAARALDIHRSRLVRAIFRGRELLMHSEHTNSHASKPLVDETLGLGWGMLTEVAGREIVMGSVTRPWEPDVHFWSLPPDEFARFDAPGYAKIVWNLAATPVDADHSLFFTETRVGTTDGVSRERFRRYWTVMSPGIVLIRRLSLRIVRSDAEQRYRERAEGVRGRLSC